MWYLSECTIIASRRRGASVCTEIADVIKGAPAVTSYLALLITIAPIVGFGSH